MADLKSDPRIPEIVRGMFNIILADPPLALVQLPGSLQRQNASSSGRIVIDGKRVDVFFNETLRLSVENYEATRGVMVASIRAQRENNPVPGVQVTGGDFNSDGETHTISKLEVVIEAADLDGACSRNEQTVAELSWLWELLRLVLRLKHDIYKTVGQLVTELRGQLAVDSSSAVTPTAPVPVVAAGDPLDIEADGEGATEVAQAPAAAVASTSADPLTSLDEAQRAAVTQIQSGLDAFDIKTGRLKGDALKAALAFQKAGGKFSRNTKGREDRVVVNEVRVDMSGKFTAVANLTGVSIKPPASAIEKLRGKK